MKIICKGYRPLRGLASHEQVRGAHVSIKPGVKRAQRAKPQDQATRTSLSPRSGRQRWPGPRMFRYEILGKVFGYRPPRGLG